MYLHSCPNCGGSIADDRLHMKLPCPRCLPLRVPVETLVDAAKLLRERGRLREGSPLDFYARVEEQAREVEELFEKATGSRLWSAQRTWVRRVLKGKSFAIIAPTGVGKTTFGVLMAVYLAWKGYKTYIVVPTTPLVMMVEEKAKSLVERLGLPVRVVALHSRLKSREKREREEMLYKGEFDVLITTARFLTQRAEDLAKIASRFGGFRFIFVDDVDAVLKSGKSVDAVLRVAGFTGEHLEKAEELLRLQRMLPRIAQRARSELERRLEEARRRARKEGRMLTAEEVRRIRLETMKRVLGEYYEQVYKLVEELEEARKKAAVLVVSSATGRPRGRRIRLFRVLLGFEAGSRSETIRNIVDSYIYPEKSIEETVARIVERLGGGGLVYVPVDKGVEYAEKLAEYLRSQGISAEAFTSKNLEALERFRRGETSVLVGVAVYYGVAVRGLDLPERIRYAVFAGIPRLKFSARFEDPHPVNVVRALAVLAEYAPRDVAEEAERRLARARRLLQRLSQAALARVAQELREGKLESDAAKEFMDHVEFVRRALARSDVWEALEKAPDISIRREEGRTYLVIPDTATYIQASGRTSRLYAGGITKGLSVVVVDDEKLLNGLIKRTRWMVEAEWKPFNQLDLDKLLREIDEDRKRVREVIEGKVRPEVKELVKTALMIVESPNKARTIASFFGRPSTRQIGPLRVYEVSTGDYVLLIAASGGHVYDLVKPSHPSIRATGTWLLDAVKWSTELYDWETAVNSYGVLVASKGPVRYLPVYAPLARCLVCGHQWAPDPETYNPVRGARRLVCPVCGSPFVKSSWDTIEALRDLATEVDVVMIGTDPDTEGEKIGWDLASLIAPFARSIVRIEFHEVTRRAILEALKNFRSFDENLVKAQIVRRVEDRWIGFSLSPLLWTHFWPEYCKTTIMKRMERLKKRMAKLKKLLAKIRRMDSRRFNEIAKRFEELKRKEKQLLIDIERVCNKPNYNLSAGRVQTPVLGWIVERTLHRKYEMLPLYQLSFTRDGKELVLELPATELDAKLAEVVEKLKKVVREAIEKADMSLLAEAEKLAAEKRRIVKTLWEELKRSGARALVEVVEEKTVEVKPFPPFTTDTLLAEAADELGMSAPEAMRIAQDLFELGLITYHRTDSTRVSEAGIAVAREYLREKYGEERLREVFAPRTWGAGGAHEAIRPTRPIDADRLRRLVEEGVIQLARPLTRRHYQFYELIFKRFIASQMKPGKIRIQKVRVTIQIGERQCVREEERVVGIEEHGFLEVYNPFRIVDRLEPGEYVLKKVGYRAKWSPVPPITQADAVRMMKERGIGRPSTYAKIIETLVRRGYVVSRGARGVLMATSRGIGVFEFLYKNFRELVSEETTRSLQEAMDMIESGRKDYQEVLDHVLEQLAEKLESQPDYAETAPPRPGR